MPRWARYSPNHTSLRVLRPLYQSYLGPGLYQRHARAVVSSSSPKGASKTGLRPSHNFRPQLRKDITSRIRRRSISFSSLPAVLVPPVVFTGLLVTLWTYKCIIMILFQNKIIYMPSMPPFSRSEKISDYTRSCSPVIWEEKKIKSIDGTTITLCVGNMPARLDPAPPKHTAILYFQGNGSSLPPRLPGLSSVLRALSNNSEHTYSIIALSYRGYWTSRGAPSERGISMDAQSVIAYTLAQYPDSTLILWGQSLGASVATTATARYFSDLSHSSSLTEENAKVNPSQSRINALILETPFLSIRSMLTELYPQRWLPYRYLHPFLWNHWESEAALRIVSSTSRSKGIEAPRMLILQAENDEVVPAMQSERLEEVGREVGLGVERKVVRGSLHTEVLVKAQGRAEVVRFLQENV